MDFKDKLVLVLGLGRFGGGVGVTKYLIENGAQVRVSDILNREQLKESIDKLSNLKIDYRLGGHSPEDLENVDLVVINSAIAPSHPYLQEIERRRIPYTTEVNIFFENCPGKIIAVIGTNGKETVVRFISKILNRAKIDNIIGGNIGKSLLNELKNITPQTYVIFEISSFQLNRLRLIKRRPDIAVYTNIQQDHLDWHGSMENYINDKAVALVGQGSDSVAIINCDNKYLNNITNLVEGRLIRTSRFELNEGIFVSNDNIIARFDNKDTILSTTKLNVPGQHNIENALSAIAVAYVLNLDRNIVEPAILEYKGIENALEIVGQKDGITFVNDSEATNPEATMAGLDSFDKPIWLIAGGFDKKIDYQPLVEAISKKVVGLATIGQLTNILADKVSQLNGNIKINRAENLEKAYNWIMENIGQTGIVLLSPGTSSYDQFNNLEERGEMFRQLVKKDINVA
jgi:UDP-N-acetylmuramoylalanine--D-glutamate ligase